MVGQVPPLGRARVRTAAPPGPDVARRAPRILVVIPVDLRVGAGGELDMIELCGQLKHRGWDVHILQLTTTFGNERRLTSEEVASLLEGIPVDFVPAMRSAETILPLPAVPGWPVLVRWIDWSDVVLVSQYYGIDLLMWVGCRLRGRPLFLTQGNTLLRGRSPVLKEVAQDLYQVSVGSLVRRWVSGMRVCNADDGRIVNAEGQPRAVVVHPASPWTTGAEGSALSPLRPSSGDGRLRALFAGRMTFQKGPDLIAASLRLLLDDDPTWTDRLEVRIAGGSALVPPLAEIARDHPGLVVRLGVLSRARLKEEMASADVLVMPSRYESFGISALEAQWLGTPVLATDVRGLRDIVLPGETGFIVPARPDRIAESLRECWRIRRDEPARWMEMRQRARDRARERFGPAARAQQIERLVGLFEEGLPR